MYKRTHGKSCHGGKSNAEPAVLERPVPGAEGRRSKTGGSGETATIIAQRMRAVVPAAFSGIRRAPGSEAGKRGIFCILFRVCRDSM